MQFFKLLILSLLVSGILFSDDKLLDSSFIGLNVGYAYCDSSKEGSFEPDFEIDNDGASYGVEMGYRITENIFYTMNYDKYHFDARSFDNYYLSANYLFKIKEKFSVYLGAVSGWSSVLWREEPIDLIATSESRSGNYLVGAQVGFEFEMNKSSFLYYSYMYGYSPQDIQFYDSTTINYTHRHNVVMGFRYYL